MDIIDKNRIFFLALSVTGHQISMPNYTLDTGIDPFISKGRPKAIYYSNLSKLGRVLIACEL